MSIDTVWVLAETADANPISTTLELLTEARALGSTVEAVAWGPDTAAVAGELGNYGATTVHDTGDLGGSLPGAPVAARRGRARRVGEAARRHPRAGHLRRP